MRWKSAAEDGRATNPSRFFAKRHTNKFTDVECRTCHAPIGTACDMVAHPVAASMLHFHRSRRWDSELLKVKERSNARQEKEMASVLP